MENIEGEIKLYEKKSRALFLNFMSQLQVSKYRSMKNFILELFVFVLVRGIQIFHILYLGAWDVDLLYFHPSNQLLLFTLFPTLIDILHPICAICLQILLFRSIIRYRRTLDIKKQHKLYRHLRLVVWAAFCLYFCYMFWLSCIQ